MKTETRENHPIAAGYSKVPPERSGLSGEKGLQIPERTVPCLDPDETGKF